MTIKMGPNTTLLANINNILYKATLAPFVRIINKSKLLNKYCLPRRIVICGPPRTGTTLLNECMKSFDNISIIDYESPALRYPYLSLGKDFILTKYPMDILDIDNILTVYKNAWIIFMIRDPRDVIISKHYKEPDRYWVDFKEWNDSITIYERMSEYDNKILIRYEDLINAPNEVQNNIREKLGLEKNYNFTDFFTHTTESHKDVKALSGVRPIDPNNTKKWTKDEHFDRIKQQLLNYPELSDILVKYGYEKSNDWESLFK